MSPDGLVVVDKPGGMTSHDVVARVRRLAGTRRVGHAGTLDPMATGVLLLGVGRATRLLGHLALADKDYEATVRLGVATDTDDAEGRPVAAAGAPGVPDAAVLAGLADLTGDLAQVPSSYSAVRRNGVRAHQAARAGTPLELAARPVTVHELRLLARRDTTVEDPRGPLPVVDLDVAVRCSTGTYVRALARDLGEALGTGGHLTALRRSRVGAFTLDAARTLDQIEARWEVLSLASAVGRAFPRRETTAEEATALRFGRPLVPSGCQGPVGAFAHDEVLALVEDRAGMARPLVVFAAA